MTEGSHALRVLLAGRDGGRNRRQRRGLMLTHVDYASGEIHDMRRLSDLARQRGVLSLWDLSHSAGAVPIDLNGSKVDLAVGCGYKYLNGGPGAPAYLFVSRELQAAMQSPLSGWMGHRDPFAFERDYAPAEGIRRQLAGSPPILSMAALEVAIDIWLRVDQSEARRKSMALGDLFIKLIDDNCSGFDLPSSHPATQPVAAPRSRSGTRMPTR